MEFTQSNARDGRFVSFEVSAISPESSAASFNDEMDIDTASDVLRIAIDFGTTFSSVAYTRTPASQKLTTLRDISCISHYPDDQAIHQGTWSGEIRQDVPTELWYHQPSTPGFSQHRAPGAAQNGGQYDGEASSDSDSSNSSSDSSPEADRVAEDAPRLTTTDRDESFDNLRWGFEVQNKSTAEATDINRDRQIARFKLLLNKPKDESENAVSTQLTMVDKVEKLKRSKLIKSNTDVFDHFLTKLFVHVKNRLELNNELKPGDDVEFTLCVPAEWPSKACRIMQESMTKAAKKSGLGQLRGGSLGNLFIVSEPEAAATCILAESLDRVYPNETIVILDAGGGTVDAVTYKVTNSDPLRMSAEVIPPKTILCGASYINEEYEKFLLEKLKNELYLEKNGKTIRSIIGQKVVDFENNTKRIWNMNDKQCYAAPIYIDDLQPSSVDPQLTQNRLHFTRKDVKKIFRPSLTGTVEVLENQLEMAKAKGETVQRVILTGGFGQSPYLQSKLKRFLDKQLNLDNQKILFLVSKASSTAVARGAVLRASNKELGPIRKSACSYGFLSSEPYQPNVWDAHKVTKPRTDPVDGDKYVHNTINWLFQKGQELEVGKTESIVVKHTFAITRKHLICEEVLYVSDDKRESHYRVAHAMNKGAEIAGSILVDMTFLRDEEHIHPEPVPEYSAFAGKNKRVWVVEFDLVLRVEGRNLVYEARWPKESEGYGTVKARGQICIAATFRPGTA